MNKDKINEILTITLGVMSVIAIMGLLINNNFDTNQVLGSIINFTQVAVPVIVLLVAMKIRRKSESYSEIGKKSLEKLQKMHPDILTGPRYNREGYDPETGKGLEYLFVKDIVKDSKNRAKFIPIQSLDQGVLAIYIQKGTLAWGLNYGEGKVKEEEIEQIQNEIRYSVKELLEKKYGDLFDILENKNNSAIIIDFKELEMGRKLFSKAIFECAETPTLKLKNKIRDVRTN